MSKLKFDQQEIYELVKKFESGQSFAFSPEQIVIENVKRLEEEGISEEVNAKIAANMLGRIRYRRMLAEMKRNIIHVQEMPPGANPIYLKEPDNNEK